ncbi:MAG TPA: response regulator [Burkholderiales bacterium]|nr:response regulator [Burkholderiales bacterium]
MNLDRTLVLHVEDDASQQSLVRIALEQLGTCLVQSAGDGFEALAMARAQLPQLLLLDLHLPGMDGVATLRSLRAIDGLREVPAIFLTAAGPGRLDEEMRALGVREVLGKPFSPRRLVQTVARVLGPAPA